MSRTRIVMGNYTKITGGNHNMYSAKSIITEAHGNIVENGKENGVIHGTPEWPEEKDDVVNVFVGMFFDGTGNNRFNSESVYYSKIHSQADQYVASSIPPYCEKVLQKDGKSVKIHVADTDSYWNPYSNVVKLYDLYKKIEDTGHKDTSNESYGKHVILKRYVEGIGTKQGEEDGILSSAVARGKYGVISRVEEGIRDLVEDTLKVVKDKKIGKIVFDVFGFSRGATAARHFCNEIAKKAVYENEMVNDPFDKFPIASGKKIISAHAGGYLGEQLKANGYQSKSATFNIETRFLGLFETVISDGIVKENLGYKAGVALSLLSAPIAVDAAIAQASLQDIKTDIGHLNIGNVFHIKAHDEWRENFAFTPSKVGQTIELPGAHSDIGGGYANLDQYKTVLDFFDVKLGDKKIWEEKNKVRQFFIDRGFSTENEIQFVNTFDTEAEDKLNFTPFGVFSTHKEFKVPANYTDVETNTINFGVITNQYKKSEHYMLIDTRYIPNEYSLIPMYVMLNKALKNKLPFYKTASEASPTPPFLFEYELNDPILKNFLNYMLEVEDGKHIENGAYPINQDTRNYIYNKFLHLSSGYGGIERYNIHTGENSYLGKYGFINRPVPYKLQGHQINYEREIYTPKK